jgi:actin beta/gamma 1
MFCRYMHFTEWPGSCWARVTASGRLAHLPRISAAACREADGAAGRDLGYWIQKLLNQRGCAFTTASGRQVVRDIKEKLAYVALDFDEDLRKAATTNDCNASYRLLDGSEIIIGNERFRCGELLFQQSLNGLELDGIDDILIDSIMMCDFATRNDLLRNICLAGGTVMMRDSRRGLRRK